MKDNEHRTIREISISQFKAKCLSLLQEVDKTKFPIRVTRHGRPIVDVIPIPPEAEGPEWIGSMSGSVAILGDVVSPVIDLQDIEAMKD